jgi:hypothetical protein
VLRSAPTRNKSIEVLLRQEADCQRAGYAARFGKYVEQQIAYYSLFFGAIPRSFRQRQ